MTRRISICILLTVLTILVGAGVSTYITARAVLLADLDKTIAARAASLPGIADASGNRFELASPIRGDDRFVVRNEIGQTLDRPTGSGGNQAPEILDAAFVAMPGALRYRRVTLRAFARPVASDGSSHSAAGVVPVTMTFSGSAVEFDRLTGKLAWTLIACGVVGSAIAAFVAIVVARASLRPLRTTAQTIAAIGEHELHQRINTARLPPELEPVARRLNELLERLDEAMTRRKRFLADAAHELRTPVAAMLTAIEVVLRRPREPIAYREALASCLDDVRVLRELVESLMTQARAEVPALTEPAELTDLGSVLGKVIGSLLPLANEKSIGLDLDVSDGLSLRVPRNRLRGMVTNLVANAIEHSRPGDRVTVKASMVTDKRNRASEVRLAVMDTGPGIPAQHLPHLFEPFYRVDRARNSADGHLGLGLFLVKTHAAALGGRCTVTSTVGEGTTFELLLPIPETSSHEAFTQIRPELAIIHSAVAPESA